MTITPKGIGIPCLALGCVIIGLPSRSSTLPFLPQRQSLYLLGKWSQVRAISASYNSFFFLSTNRCFNPAIIAAGKEEDPSLSYLLFLQGGPGFESPRPTASSGWLKRACDEHRVILLDQAMTPSLWLSLVAYLYAWLMFFFIFYFGCWQRGTGLSTPLTVSSLSQITPVDKLVDFVKHFRADSIVKDAEFIRLRLVPNGGPWTVLGQVFVFCFFFCTVFILAFECDVL